MRAARKVSVRNYVMQRTREEIVQGDDSTHHRGQGFGNGNIRCVGEVPDTVQIIIVHRCAECIFHLAGGTAEFDAAPAGGDFGHLKTLRGEPRSDGVEVGLSGAELCAKLFGSRARPGTAARMGPAARREVVEERLPDRRCFEAGAGCGPCADREARGPNRWLGLRPGGSNSEFG